MTSRIGLAATILALAVGALYAEHPALARLEAVAGLERRSRECLEFALAEFGVAVTAYGTGDLVEGQISLDAVASAVEMAVTALGATGKHPRRHPRHFKRAEIQTRKLLGDMREAQRKAHIDDQPDFEAAILRVEKANGDLLVGIMSPRN